MVRGTVTAPLPIEEVFVRRAVHLSSPGALAALAGFLCSCGTSVLEQYASTEDGFFPSDGIRLYYELDIPNGAGPHPVIVLGHGSQRAKAGDARNRAGRLVEQGIAVLRFDKRGVGRSEGVYSKSFANLTVLARDMVAAVESLRQDPRIDPTRMGLLGVSQAGWVIPMAAASSPEVDFIVLLVGPTVTPWHTNYWDSIARADLTIDELETRLSSFVPPSDEHDLRPYLKQLEIPGLWLFGEEDRIIPTRSSVAILQALVESDGNEFSYIVYPDVGHGLEVDYWPDLFEWFERTVR